MKFEFRKQPNEPTVDVVLKEDEKANVLRLYLDGVNVGWLADGELIF